MAFTAKDVQALREITGSGMMDCKKALTESDGDFDKAIEFLREKGLATAAKKAGRIASEGLVDVYTSGDVSVLIEVNSETDFVAKNDEFKSFVNGCAKTVADTGVTDVAALLETKFDGGQFTVSEVLTQKIAKIGENMSIRRFTVFKGAVASYIHGGKVGVMALFETTAKGVDFEEMGKNICMQVTAMNPTYLNKEQVPAEIIDSEKSILMQQILNDDKNKNKPEAVIEKMISGRINKYFETNCLKEQLYVKDDKVTVNGYIQCVAKALGVTIELKEFVRFEKGEGLEKKVDNFADEVAGMIK